MPLFHSIEPKDLWTGDHIYIWRGLALYQHHGIVLFVDKNDPDESRVLEFNTSDGSHKPWRARIQEVSLKQFRGNSTIRRVMYNSDDADWKLKGTAHREQSLVPEHVVDNAQLLLEQIKFGDCPLTPNDPTGTEISYHILLRNCECLAFWCKTGRWFSAQVEKMIHWFGSALSILFKTLASYLINEDKLAIGQEPLSETIEKILPSLTNRCYDILQQEILGNAIASIVTEFIETIWRCYSFRHGQMTQRQFFEQTLRSLINGFMTGVFATAVQTFLLGITAGTAALIMTDVAGLVGTLLGSMVGNLIEKSLLSRLFLNENDSLTIGKMETTH